MTDRKNNGPAAVCDDCKGDGCVLCTPEIWDEEDQALAMDSGTEIIDCEMDDEVEPSEQPKK